MISDSMVCFSHARGVQKGVTNADFKFVKKSQSLKTPKKVLEICLSEGVLTMALVDQQLSFDIQA